MTRKTVAHLVFTALALTTASSALVGCTAHAQFGSEPQAPPPAPVAQPVAVAPPAATPAPTPAPVPVAEPPKEKVSVKDGRIGIPGNIVYETGKAILKPESEPTLNALKDFMTQNPAYTRVRVEGHTDNIGKPEDNLKLSADRAAAVVQWLADHGLPKERVLAVGFGSNKPIADNSTEAGRAQNRRTEFHIAEVAGKPFLNRDESGGGQVSPGQPAFPAPTVKN